MALNGPLALSHPSRFPYTVQARTSCFYHLLLWLKLGYDIPFHLQLISFLKSENFPTDICFSCSCFG